MTPDPATEWRRPAGCDTGTEGNLAAAFASLAEQRVGALLVRFDAFCRGARDQVISFAARYAMPALYLESKPATSGGLSSCGPDLVDEYRQLGDYTGRVLRGEKPHVERKLELGRLGHRQVGPGIGYDWHHSGGEQRSMP
jgi:hypothetical protein